MKTFIFSYVVSVTLVSLYWLPSIIADPLQTIPRICIYLGYPLALLLSMTIIAVSGLIKSSKSATGGIPAIVGHEGQNAQLIEKQVA
ncbi:hypothetical protein KJ966_12775 [bacterium]|nr:hypothetical protein [bacterium]